MKRFFAMTPAWSWGVIYHQLQCSVLCLTLLATMRTFGASLPTGFVEDQIGGTWTEAVGLTFAQDGRAYVWERAGRVWIVEHGIKSATPFLDISQEVAGYRDFGLLGFALHPDFYNNGQVYLMYIVDRHHLMHFGTSNYNVSSNQYYQATIGRITRYTARVADGFRSVDPSSRRILLGESPSTGFPILHESHGIGTLVFGTDGTLLASCGDGASYASTDVGSANETYYQQGLNDGIIRQKENVGAYRAQLVDCLNGKILRLDPATGDGIPGNPFYDSLNPRAPRSRVWALGLRNPFRMTLRLGTGSHNPDDANPGALYIGDVGYNTWEDLNVCDRPGQNFGWPAFEGLTVQTSYFNSNVPNRDAPNPLFGTGGCTQQFFYFRDLIRQDSLLTPSWPNPCQTSVQIPAAIPRFVHRRPAVDWRHGQTLARTGTFVNNQAAEINVGASGSPVSGAMFPGNSSTGGAWQTNAAFPPPFRNTYFHADYGAGWIRSFSFTADNKPTAVRDFTDDPGGVVDLEVDPTTGDLYYIAWTAFLRRIRYEPSGNQPPTAQAAADIQYGPAPLNVQFSSAGSSDPEGQPLSYLWNFGDGTPASSLAAPAHVFNAPPGVPTPFTVTLVVTDSGGASATNRVLVSVNNTPPQVTINSPVNGTRYSLTSSTSYPCTATLLDAEHGPGQLTCAWLTILHHNNHEHQEPVDPNCTTTTLISPVGCGGETYYYRVLLTVSDAAGLSTTREVRLYPDCPPTPPSINFPPQSQIVFLGASTTLFVSATGDLPLVYQWRKGEAPLPGQTNDFLVLGSARFADAGDYTVVVSNSLGSVTSSPPAVITIVQPPLPPETLVALGSSWSYLDDGSNQGTAWSAPAFNHSSWRAGLAQLGYGDGDESTVVRSNRTDGSRIVTTYFRRAFTLNNASEITNLTVQLIRDDGANGYLNGSELFRNNMPAGTIASTTFSATVVSDEGTLQEFSVDPNLLVEGPNIIAVEVHQANLTSTDVSFDLALIANRSRSTGSGPTLGFTNTLVSTGAVWRYRDTGIDLGSAWRAPLFDDAAWANGPGKLGFSDAPVTTINIGPAGARYITTYFRHAFDVDQASEYTNLAFRVLRDDGVVVYLNDAEQFRMNMPGGTIAFGTLASVNVANADETTYFAINTPASALTEGRNVLAVELHQNAMTSSDAGFDLELVGRGSHPEPPIVLLTELLASGFLRLWIEPAPSRPCVLEASVDFETWEEVMTTDADGNFEPIDSKTTPWQFYRAYIVP